MANPLKMADLNLANHQGKTWRKNIRGGVLASLAPKFPELKVGSTDLFTFTGTPKAQLLGEAEAKTSADGTPTKVVAKTYKVQLTYRYTDELQWADEDYQTQVIDNLVANIATALSRAVDLVAIHGINPATGNVAGQVSEYFTKSGNGINKVTVSGNAKTDMQTAAGQLQAAGYMATGIGFDPVYAGQLARVEDTQGRPMFPELGLGFGFSAFQGLQAAASDTISGRQELAANNVRVRALMGDFRAFEWGVARDVPLELIKYGDPDGLGDLKRLNQVAIRAESVFGFAIYDYKAFSLMEGAPAS